MSDRTLSFADGDSRGDPTVDRTNALCKRVQQLEYNIEAFIKNVDHVRFNVDAADAPLWMLDWERQLLDGHLKEEEDDSSEQEPYRVTAEKQE